MKTMTPATSRRTLIAILVIAALAIAFWALLLSPKRSEMTALGKESEELQTALATAQGEVAAGETARHDFADNYQQLVVLGKAVPASDESASLLVQLNGVANRSKVHFESLQQGTPGESAAPAEAEPEPAPETAPAVGESAPTPEGEAAAPAAVPPSEAAASLSPLGSSVGPAGLDILPYNLNFKGSFFHVADFINGIDSLIRTSNSNLAVDGRLITLDGFSLTGDSQTGFPKLDANFAVTTYLVPPDEGIVGGASPTEAEGAASVASSAGVEAGEELG
jgi:Tfp pilus assembly protein PilO